MLPEYPTICKFWLLEPTPLYRIYRFESLQTIPIGCTVVRVLNPHNTLPAVLYF